MRLLQSVCLVVACGSAVILSGCALVRQDVKSVDPNKAKPMDAKYDYSDQRSMTDELVQQIVKAPFLEKTDKAPIAVVLDIENRTRRHIDTKTIGDTLGAKLLQTGKLQFVDAARRDDLLKEQQYQLHNATAETRAAIGKQLGAKYMIYGSISDDVKESGRQVRISKKEEIYYLLLLKITDLETGLVVATPQAERVRQASQPLIGW